MAFMENPDAKRYLGTFFCVGMFLFMLYQISLAASYDHFEWTLLFPMIFSIALLALEQVRGKRVIIIARAAMWFAWSLFASILLVRQFAVVIRAADWCKTHTCNGPRAFQDVFIEVEVFIYLLPLVVATVISVFMVFMSKREYMAPAGTYDAFEGTSADGAPSSSATQGSYYTL